MGQQAAGLTSLSGGLTPIGTVGTGITAPSTSELQNMAGLGSSAAGGAGAGALSSILGFAPLGLSAVSTLMSFAEAGKMADKKRAAEREQDRKIEEAKRLIAQNEYEAVRVPTEAYERAFREGTAANAQALQTVAQDPRTLLGAVQGIQEATIEGQAQSREALADRLYKDAMAKAGAKMDINEKLAKIAEQEAEGASIAAMAAEKANIKQQQAGIQGIGNLITQGAGMVGTYGKLATPEDNLNNLKSAVAGSIFGKGQTTTGLESLTQNPEMLKKLLALLGQQNTTTTLG